jgi:hypothetical protein
VSFAAEATCDRLRGKLTLQHEMASLQFIDVFGCRIEGLSAFDPASLLIRAQIRGLPTLAAS